MLENLADLLPGLGAALGQILTMLGIALCAATVFGGPLGILLFLSGAGQRPRRHPLAQLAGWTADAIRAFPFVALLVVLLPMTRVLAGSSIGPLAATVPLALAAVPCFARLVEHRLREVPHGVVEAAQAMGASELQVVTRVLLVEAGPGLVLALTAVAIGLLAYCAVAGVLGGGIGEFAGRHGAYRFDTDIMVFTVAVLVALLQVIQLTGTRLARRLDRG
jgi:D-methionine transport system permease protein